MGLPVAEDRICDAERELGRTLPGPLRDRLMRENGGEIATAGYPSEDAGWELHSVWDPSDRKRATRSANHLVRETLEEHTASGGRLPDGSVVIASNGTGDLLLVLEGDDQVHWWDHETREVHPVTVDWS